jgi:hypothetical protein
MAMTPRIVDRADFDGLFTALVDLGYTPVGPTLADAAIRYGEVRSASDLPAGWGDEQDRHLSRRSSSDEALFRYQSAPIPGSDISTHPAPRFSRSRGRTVHPSSPAR